MPYSVIKKLLFFFVPAVFFSGCIDPIDINIKEGEVQLAVDGMITDQSMIGSATVPDTIRLTKTNGYLKGPVPVVSNALVILKDNIGNVDTLEYTSNGKYITHVNKIKGVVGNIYELNIYHEGEHYQATDDLKKIMAIDSLYTDYRTEPKYGRAPGYFVNIIAIDLKGPGDFYRLKTYKNGDLYNRPEDLNIAADAGFSSNAPQDNVNFIFPIREFLNPRTGEVDAETQGDIAPYIPGDNVKVEMYSLSAATYSFYLELQKQTINDGLFAGPSVNVKTNILNTNPSSNKKAVGWFSASAVSSKSTVIVSR
jgi:hypothetical protein